MDCANLVYWPEEMRSKVAVCSLMRRFGLVCCFERRDERWWQQQRHQQTSTVTVIIENRNRNNKTWLETASAASFMRQLLLRTSFLLDFMVASFFFESQINPVKNFSNANCYIKIWEALLGVKWSLRHTHLKNPAVEISMLVLMLQTETASRPEQNLSFWRNMHCTRVVPPLLSCR